ncbi:hypothetical protein N0V86_000321 [Didymella sp. IMI 355093]|nr:hypothetical protein N0V86_000321 [Didymella sp. IMI 355093]
MEHAITTILAATHPLLADEAITERSRKFYDGTYQWDSDGFTDEHGVYREYDCMDPLARAPTPLPPIFLKDDDNEVDGSQVNAASTETTQYQDSMPNAIPTGRAPVEPDTPCPKADSTTITTDVPRTPGSIRRFAINLLSNPRQGKIASQGKAEVGPQILPDATEAPEGTETRREQNEIIEVLHRSYDLCEGPKSAQRRSSSIQMPDTPPDSPAKALSVIQTTSPAVTVSTLSPVPSNLSDQDNDEGIKAGFFDFFGSGEVYSLTSTDQRHVDRNTLCKVTRDTVQDFTRKEEKYSNARYHPESHESLQASRCEKV